ncbi:MAG: efflux RND transporter periplasmic adaptor subunit [Thermoanaerobaculia bacterium]|nr:efflux RND transporter periplasmic adaptor subunit [Thermoanaerobaculia bacterium]
MTVSPIARQRLIRFVAAAVLGLAIAACGSPPEAPPPPPPDVGTATPVRRPVTFYAERTGTTRAVRSVDINARVSGVLESMHFEPGTLVREGDLLFIIEQRLYKATRDAADAAVKSAEAELLRAESDLERVELAIQSEAVSRSDLDLARANRDMAAAQVLAAKAQLDQAELELSYTEVRAPLTGQVGRNLVDVGNVVGGSGPVKLTSINQIRPMHIYSNVPEEAVVRALQRSGVDIANLEDAGRLPAWAATLADEGFVHEGYIDFISNTVDSSTGTIEVRIRMENENLSLFPGLFVRTRFEEGDDPEGILIEERAVSTDLGGRYVYTVGEGNIAERVYVTTGQVQDDGMLPVLEGLEGNETYIVDGLLRARPGMPVNPTPAASS